MFFSVVCFSVDTVPSSLGSSELVIKSSCSAELCSPISPSSSSSSVLSTENLELANVEASPTFSESVLLGERQGPCSFAHPDDPSG